MMMMMMMMMMMLRPFWLKAVACWFNQLFVARFPAVGRRGCAMAADWTPGGLSAGCSPAPLPTAPERLRGCDPAASRPSRSTLRRRRAAVLRRRLWQRSRWVSLYDDELQYLEAWPCGGGHPAADLPHTAGPVLDQLIPVGALAPLLANGFTGMPRTVALLARGWLPYAPVNLAWHVRREYGTASPPTVREVMAGHRELHEIDMARCWCS